MFVSCSLRRPTAKSVKTGVNCDECLNNIKYF